MDWKSIIASLQEWGFSQAQIAEACGCGQSTISEILKLPERTPTYRVGEALKALHKRERARRKRLSSVQQHPSQEPAGQE